MVVAPPLVAFDETGNTGQHLLDPAQPVFVLASVHVDDATAEQLASTLRSTQMPEAKFITLKGSSPGRKRILEFLREPLIGNAAHVKAALYHKSFMVTTKIVDILMETLAHEMDFDLYQDGANLALANLLHTVTPEFCGAAAFAELQRGFIAMCKGKSQETVEAFYEQVAELRRLNCHAPFDETLGTLAATRAIVDRAIDEKERVLLDPAVPAFFDLTAQWTAELNVPFTIAHDESKPLAHERERLELLMTTAEQGRVLAGPGPKRKLPLLATGLTFADSKRVPQVQLADVIAGALATLYRAVASNRFDDFVTALRDDTLLQEITGEPFWPTRALSSAEFGTGRSSEALEIVMAISDRERARRAKRG